MDISIVIGIAVGAVVALPGAILSVLLLKDRWRRDGQDH